LRFSADAGNCCLVVMPVNLISSNTKAAFLIRYHCYLEGSVVRQAVLSKNHVVLAVLRFWSHGKGRGLLYVTCRNHIRKLVFL
jgi:hypothetical protein